MRYTVFSVIFLLFLSCAPEKPAQKETPPPVHQEPETAPPLPEAAAETVLVPEPAVQETGRTPADEPRPAGEVPTAPSVQPVKPAVPPPVPPEPVPEPQPAPPPPPEPAVEAEKVLAVPLFLQFSLKEVPAKTALDRNTRKVVLTVPFGTSLASLTPVFSTNGSLVRLNGADFESGSQALSWTRPQNFQLTSPDGVEEGWTAEVSVTPASKDSKLGSLQLGDYQLMPPFDPAVASYSLFVPQTLGEISLSAQSSFPKARMTIQVNDGISPAVLESGRPRTLALIPGENNLFLKVTAEDGRTNTYYVFVVKRR